MARRKPGGVCMGQETAWKRYVDEDWLGPTEEPILDAEISIVDSHHHLWSWSFKYEMAETIADISRSEGEICSSSRISTTCMPSIKGWNRAVGRPILPRKPPSPTFIECSIASYITSYISRCAKTFYADLAGHLALAGELP